MIKNSAKYELLAPAKNKETAIAAINAGADAVYIGYSKFGARKAAGNSVEDIKEIVDYANIFRVKIYVTLNTIYTDEEIEEVIKIIYKLYETGVAAIIIQDMGILEYKLPPVKIFASTQCHNNTLEKVKFLEQTGFDRVILPREFSLDEIKNITENTNIDVETFIHGALCVSYSGQCYMSYINGGRSANRGECAQPCRKKYSVISNDGKIICENKYLLSLKDFNLSDEIEELILAGVTSFKIEGRLKDVDYVTNIVAFYRQKIDEILKKYNLQKSSSGISKINFEPNPYKSFNRSFTNFNFDGKRKNICTKNYVKSLGELAGTVDKIFDKYFTLKGETLNNGDGICFFNRDNELTGTTVQKNENGKIFPNSMKDLQKGIKIYRNFDINFDKELKKQIKRQTEISATVEISNNQITLTYTDDENNSVSVTKNEIFEQAKDSEKAEQTIKNQISKTGDTVFFVADTTIKSDKSYFVRASLLNDLRRQAIYLLTDKRKNKKTENTAKEIKIIKYPEEKLTYKANILNSNAENFYKKRGVIKTEKAAEYGKSELDDIMVSKHCIKYTLGLCQKYFKAEKKYQEPLYLVDDKSKKYLLQFDCQKCEMHVKLNHGVQKSCYNM